MTAASHALTTHDSTGYIRSKLASFLAVFPLGIWTIVHLWQNLSAFQGAEAWQQSVTQHGHPVATAVSATIVLLPLLLHTLWGFNRLRTTKPNLGGYSFYANLKYLLQRLSAVGVVLFLGAHVWLAFLHPHLVEGHAETFAGLSQEMRHNVPTLPVYALGTLGVAYHLANGFYTFAMGWGIVSSRKALKRMDVFALLLFFVLLAMAWGTIFALWSAGGAVAPAHVH